MAGFNLPDPAPVDVVLPAELKPLVDDSVEKFKQKLGPWAHFGGGYIDDYRKEVERVAFCAFRAGRWNQAKGEKDVQNQT